MKTNLVILAAVLIAILLLGGMQSMTGLASPVMNRVEENLLPKPTPPAPTQPMPPSAEVGDNLPLVCGAGVLLLIVLGGVVWTSRQRKTHLEDH